MLIDRIQQFAGSLILTPIVLDLTTGSTAVVTDISNNQLILNSISLAITAITSIITTLGIAYLQAKYKVKK